MKERIAIDLFSGCGGLTQGLKQAGFNVLLGCEIRPEARGAYNLNHPEASIHPDVRELNGPTILKLLGIASGELDLLAACPPCQGFSSIRTRNGKVADDPRNDLIFEVARIIQEIQPKTILIENVPRLLKDQRLVDFQQMLEKYSFTPGILDAQDFDVPQRRKRMILIGSLNGKIELPKPLGKKKTVQDSIGDLPSPDSKHCRPLHRIRQKFSPIVAERIAKIKKNRTDLPEHLVLGCHQRYPQGFKDVYGRIAWDDVAPTMTRSSHNPSKGRFIHPVENRGLTIHEIMLLQGFPKRYKLPKNIGIGKLSSLLGEAVPPPLAQAQAKQIWDHLEIHSKKT